MMVTPIAEKCSHLVDRHTPHWVSEPTVWLPFDASRGCILSMELQINDAKYYYATARPSGTDTHNAAWTDS
jgi:hypothetical protein